VWRRNIDHFDRVVKEKTTPVSRFTTPGKGGNQKKNPGKKEPFKNLENSEERRKEADAAHRRKQMEEVFGPNAI
jgi:hypothetical protein